LKRRTITEGRRGKEKLSDLKKSKVKPAISRLLPRLKNACGSQWLATVSHRALAVRPSLVPFAFWSYPTPAGLARRRL